MTSTIARCCKRNIVRCAALVVPDFFGVTTGLYGTMVGKKRPAYDALFIEKIYFVATDNVNEDLFPLTSTIML